MDKIGKFLKNFNLPEWPQEETEYMNSPITTPHACTCVHTHPYTYTHANSETNYLLCQLSSSVNC